MNTKLAIISAALGLTTWWWAHRADIATSNMPVLMPGMAQQAGMSLPGVTRSIHQAQGPSGAATDTSSLILNEMVDDADPAQRAEEQTLMALLDTEARESD